MGLSRRRKKIGEGELEMHMGRSGAIKDGTGWDIIKRASRDAIPICVRAMQQE